jgi:hypothetical protein
MCPCLSSKSQYATCGRFTDGLMVPSVFERENYCFGLYELCPLFASAVKRNYSAVNNATKADRALLACRA